MHKLHSVMLPPVFKLQSSTQYLSLLVSASCALLVDGLLLDAPVVFLLTDAMGISHRFPEISRVDEMGISKVFRISKMGIASFEA